MSVCEIYECINLKYKSLVLVCINRETLKCYYSSLPYAENISHAISIKKHALILDLNGVLLSKEDKRHPCTDCVRIDIGRTTISVRPGCFEFLDEICQYFHVGIWSTMLHKNVCAYVSTLEKHAHKKYNFFMVWGQEDCYIHNLRKVYRPDKPNVEAMFKPLLRVWYQHKNLCNKKNTLLIDDSPFKGCVNPKDNCLYLESFQGRLDYILWNDLLPYLLNLNNVDDIRSIVSLNRLGKSPITKSHGLYTQFRDIIEEWCQFNTQYLREELNDSSIEVESSSCASSHLPIYGNKLDYVQARGRKQEVDSISKDPTKLASKFGVPLLSSNQINLLKWSYKTKNLSDQHAIAYASRLGYDRGDFISGVAAKAYISKLQKAYMSLWVGKSLVLSNIGQ